MSFKRILSLVLVLCMVLSFFPASAFANYDDEEVVEEVVEEVETFAEEPAEEYSEDPPAEAATDVGVGETEEPSSDAEAAAPVEEEEVVVEEVVEETQIVNEEAANDGESGFVAQVGTQYFRTLKEAFEAVDAGGTVTLLALTNEAVTISKNVTLNGGATKIKTLGSITVEEGAALTLQSVQCASISVGSGCALICNDAEVMVDSATASGSVVGGVKAGTFVEMNESLLAYGYVRDYATGKVSQRTGAVALIDDGTRTYYDTFAAAVTAAGTTKAIILLANPTYTFSSDTETLKLVLNGYSADGITAYTPADYYVKGTVTENFTIFSQVRYAAKVGTTGYPTFAEAATAAAGTAAIVLNDNIPEAYEMSVGETLKVQKGTYTLTVNAPDGYALRTEGTDTITYTVAPTVCKIGEVSYASLAEAVAAAKNGDTITMLANETLGSTVTFPAGKTLTLDLGGYTITAENDSTKRLVVEGNVTVTNGTIKSAAAKDDSTALIKVLGSLTLDDVTIDDVVPGVETNAVWPAQSGRLIVNDAEITAGGFAISTNGSATGDNFSNQAVIVINGGVIDGGASGIYLPAGSATINGGEISGATGIYTKGGKLVIPADSTAEITAYGTKEAWSLNNNGANPTGDAIVLDNSSYPYGPAQVTIAGGTFESRNADAIGNYAVSGQPTATKVVSGGTFSSAVPEAMCAKDFIPEKNDDGTYGVKKGTFTYRVVDMPTATPAVDSYWTTSGVGYEEAQLEDAVKAAMNKDGKVLVLAGADASATFAARATMNVYAGAYEFTAVAEAGVKPVTHNPTSINVVEKYTAGASYLAKVTVEGKDQYFDSIGGASGALAYANANSKKGAVVSFLAQPTSGITYTMAADAGKTLVIDWADYDSDAVTVSAPDGFFPKTATEGTVTTYSLTEAVAAIADVGYFETFEGAATAAAVDYNHRTIVLRADIADAYNMVPAVPTLMVDHNGHSLTVVAPDGYALKDTGTLVPETRTIGVTNTTGTHIYTIVQKFTYTFKPENGENDIVRTVYADTNLTAPPVVTKEGYKDLVWKDEDGVAYPTIPTTSKPSSDKTYTAEWTAKKYKLVSFSYSGSKLLDSRWVSYDEEIFAPVKQPVSPGAGNNFVTWAIANTNSQWIGDDANYTPIVFPFILDKSVLGDIEEGGTLNIYGIWEKDVHAVSFDADGGYFMTNEGNRVSSVENVDIEVGEPLVRPVKNANPVKTGYTFKYWEYNNGIQVPTSELPENMPTENRSYVAVWEIIKNSITYSDTSDKTLPKFFTVEDLPLTIGEISYPGYTFNGWTSTTLGITDPQVEVVIPEGTSTAVELKANWTMDVYTLSFNPNGGSVNTSGFSTYTVEDQFTLPQAEWDGHTFLGWTGTDLTEPTMNVTVAKGSTGDREYTANWSVKPVTVTINYNNGGATKTDKYTVDFGKPINQPTIPDYEGHTFIGCFLGGDFNKPMEFPYSPATYPEDGVTIVLGWNVNKHSVTLNANGGKFDINDKDTFVYNNVEFGREFAPLIDCVVTRNGYELVGWTMADGSEVPETMPDADVEAVAVWEAKPVTVTINYNDGGATKTDKYTVPFGTQINQPTIPEYEGHTFIGCFLGGDINKPMEFPYNPETYPVDGSVTIVLGWNVNKHSITYMAGDGKWVDGSTEKTAAEVAFGATVSDRFPGENPKLEGYDFKAWVLRDGSPAPATMPDDDVVLYAYYTPHVYKITYNRTESAAKLVNPETGVTDQSNYQVEVAYGAEIPEAPVLIYAGHSYEWIEAKYGYNVPDTMPASDLTFNAKWEGINYVYTFDGNGGQIKDMHNDYVDLFYVVANYDDATVINHVFAGKREGYTAHSWMTEEGKHIDALPNPLPAEDTTYTVVWNINKWNVTFRGGGAKIVNPETGIEENTVTLKDVEYGSEVVYPEDPTLEGYTFNGWKETVDGFTPVVTMPDRDLSFTADWTINKYTITLDGNGGMFVNAIGEEAETFEITENYDTALGGKYPVAPKLEGYTLVGWSGSNGEAYSVTGVPANMPAYDLTLTAVWEINKWNVTFSGGGAKVVNPETGIEENTVTLKDVEYGSEVVYPEDPTLEGYTFNGWRETVDGFTPVVTMPDRNLAFVAVWAADEHTITLDANGGVFVNDLGEVSPTFEFTGKYGEAVTYPDNDTLRLEGYTFKGWVGPDGVIGHRPTTVPAEDVTYTALWEVNEYDVYFRPNNAYAFITNSVNAQTIGQGQILNLKVKYGEEIPYPEIEAAGFEFECWVEDRTGYDLPVTMPAYAVGLTAKWKGVDFTVTFDGNGGLLQTKALDIDPANTTHVDWVESYTVMGARLISAEQNLQALLPTYAVRPGFAFHGFVDQNGRHYDPGQLPTSFGPEDMTFKAEWVRLSYNATFNSKGGALVDPNKNLPAPNGVFTEEVLFEDPILFPEDPVMKGYTFDGWAEVLNGYGRNYPDTMPVPSNAAGLVFEAQWKINEYTVTYDADGGIMETKALDDGTHDDKVGFYMVTGKYGDAMKNPTSIAKAGYTFHGWVDQDGKHYGEGQLPGTIPAKDMIFKAVWEVNSYWVTFDAINGRTYAAKAELMNPNTGMIEADGRYEQKVVFDTAIPFPADPVLKGYTFAGWAEVKDGYGYNHPETMPVPNTKYGLVFEAQWVPEEHSITFDANGGDLTSPDGRILYSNPYSFTLPTDKAIDTNVYYNFVPRLEGYKFQYWIGSDGKIYGDTHFALPTTMPAEDLTLTAVWDIQEYYVYFVPRGGQVTDPITLVKQPTDVNVRVLVKFGDPIPYAEVERKGYEFDTWVEDYYGKVLPETAPALPEGRDGLYFRAVWKGLDYTVTFDGNGGTIETTALDGSTADPQTHKDYVESYTVIGNFGFTIKSPTFVGRDGYTFLGWVDQNGKHYNFGQTPTTFPAEDMVFTAQWTPLEQKVTFNANNGMVVNPFTGVIVPTFEYKVKSDEAITYPADPVRTGYEFKGWQEDGDLKLGFLHPETMPAKGKDLVFYAQWAPIPNTVVYDANGGTVLNKAAEPVEILTIEAKTGEAIYVPTEKPVRYGYDFSAWLDSKDNWLAPGSTAATMPAEGETYTARWEPKTINVTFWYDFGTATPYAEKQVKFDQLVIAPMDPVKKGYTFEGWYTYTNDPDRLLEPFDFSKPVDTEEDIQLVAKWEIAVWTVTFDINGGMNTIPDQRVQNGKKAVDPSKNSTMYRNGYTFVEWRVRNDNGTIGDAWNFDWTVEYDLNLVAMWEGRPVTLRWADRNVYVSTQFTHVGDFIVRPEFNDYYFQQLIKDGRVENGVHYRLDPDHLWYPEPPEYVEERMNGMMYTLQWIKQVEFSYVNQNGRFVTTEVNEGATLADIAEEIAKPGTRVVFEDISGNELDMTTPISELEGELIYAKSKNQVDFSYIDENGDIVTETFDEGTTLADVAKAIAKPGEVVTFTDAFGNELDPSTPIEELQGELVKANINQKYYTVEFKDSISSTVYGKVTVEYKKTITKKPNDPTPTGLGVKFGGWYEKGSTAAFDFNTPITKDTTLEAVWEPIVAEPEFQTTLNMADFTGIFVYIGLPEGADASEYTVETSGGSYRVSYAQDPVAISSLPKGSGARADMYQFEAVRIASPEMTDEVTVTVKKGDTVVKSETYSVYSVVQGMLDSGSAGDGNLVKALLQYGYYGHIMFNNPLEFNPVIEGAPALVAIPETYAAKNDPTNFGAYVTNFRDTLDLNAAIAMNLYFTLAGDYNMNDFNFSVKDKNGNEYTNCSITETNDKRVLVRIEGIKSPQMDDEFKVTMTLKSDTTKTATWTRSVMICAYQGSARTSGDGVKFLQALYQYYFYANKQWPNV